MRSLRRLRSSAPPKPYTQSPVLGQMGSSLRPILVPLYPGTRAHLLSIGRTFTWYLRMTSRSQVYLHLRGPRAFPFFGQPSLESHPKISALGSLALRSVVTTWVIILGMGPFSFLRRWQSLSHACWLLDTPLSCMTSSYSFTLRSHFICYAHSVFIR